MPPSALAMEPAPRQMNVHAPWLRGMSGAEMSTGRCRQATIRSDREQMRVVGAFLVQLDQRRPLIPVQLSRFLVRRQVRDVLHPAARVGDQQWRRRALAKCRHGGDWLPLAAPVEREVQPVHHDASESGPLPCGVCRRWTMYRSMR